MPKSMQNHWQMNYISIQFASIQRFAAKESVSQLFAFAEEVAKQQHTPKLSLNVETQKEPAIRLYKRLGYEIVSPWTIIGEPFHHMVKII